MHQLKRVDAVGLLDAAHIGNHLRRTLQPEIAAEKIIGRTERAGKRTAAAQFQRKMTAVANVGKEMKSGKWQGVQVSDQGRGRIAHDFSVFIPAKRYARDCCERPVSGQGIDESGQSLLRFAAHHQVNRRIGAQRGDIHD